MASKLISLLFLLAAAPAWAQTAAGPEVDLSGLLLSLAAVVVLIIGGAFVLKRTPLGYAARGNGPLKVLATLPIGPKERLLLVDVHGVEMLVAIGPGAVAVVPAAARAARPPADLAQDAERAERLAQSFTLGDAR
jgi:flagellar protein FliO/FliZ